MEPIARLRLALVSLASVIVGGTVGYTILGFTPLEALYQTVTTVSTVGYREVRPLTPAGEIFTIVVILVGVGSALYTFGLLLEALIEGHLRQHLRRRRMEREIARMRGHVIVCGWGRVGQASAQYLGATGRPIVVVDREPARLEGVEHATVLGDVADDRVLEAAGVAHARALIAALDTDSDNVYVSLSARALNPDLIIIARARNEASKSKLIRAGANRAVNPQLIGGRRMAAFALQPHVAEFLDVVMHDENLEFRIEEIEIGEGSSLVSRRLGELVLTAAPAGKTTSAVPRESTGVLTLAVRSGRGPFVANPSPETILEPDMVVIVMGTLAQLATLRREAADGSRQPS